MKKLLLILISTAIISTSLASAQNYYSSTCADLRYDMGSGSKDLNTNGEVSMLQQFLKEEGYLTSRANGILGPATLKAVKNYQRANSLIASGYVGPVTRAEIKKDSCYGSYSYDNNYDNNYGIYNSGTYYNGYNYYTPTQAYAPYNPYIGYYNNTNIRPVACTMELRFCADGSVMPRDTDCTWRESRCPYVAIPQDYSIDLSAYSVSSSRYLAKNSNNNFDATGIDGSVNFTVTTGLAGGVECSVYLQAAGTSNYSYISSSKTFAQQYNKNYAGLDYYKVTCGGTNNSNYVSANTKVIEKIFTVETRPSVSANLCPASGVFYDYNYPSCTCASYPVYKNKVSVNYYYQNYQYNTFECR